MIPTKVISWLVSLSNLTFNLLILSEVLWETDDLKTYLANSIDPMGDGIVTLEVPFKKLHGDFQKETVCTMNSTEIDNGCDYVVAAYLRRDYKKDYIDFEE